MGSILNSNSKHMVIFQPSGSRGDIDEGKTIMEASRELGVDIDGLCGENATCGKCKVKIEEGYFEKYGMKSMVSSISPISDADRFTEPGKCESRSKQLISFAGRV